MKMINKMIINAIQSHSAQEENKCLHTHVSALLVHSNGNSYYYECNKINNPKIISCPRQSCGYKSGEGYHLCMSECNQPYHAERAVIESAIKDEFDTTGSTLYLHGHTYCCDDCMRAMKQASIKEVYIIKDDGQATLFTKYNDC